MDGMDRVMQAVSAQEKVLINGGKPEPIKVHWSAQEQMPWAKAHDAIITLSWNPRAPVWGGPISVKISYPGKEYRAERQTADKGRSCNVAWQKLTDYDLASYIESHGPPPQKPWPSCFVYFTPPGAACDACGQVVPDLGRGASASIL